VWAISVPQPRLDEVAVEAGVPSSREGGRQPQPRPDEVAVEVEVGVRLPSKEGKATPTSSRRGCG
jgi:hypothetical protein